MQIKVKCRLKIYSISFIIIFFQLLCSIYANAQTEINTKLFSEISNTQRGEFISQYPFASLDSSLFLKTWDNLFAIANKKKDKESILSLMIIKFHHRAKFKSSILEEEKLLLKIKAQAQENNNETVQLYTEHYLNFNAYLSGKISPEKMYGVVQKDYENICNHGLKNFKKYNIAKLLFHNGEFMYKLEDFDKALEYLKKAEQFPSDDVRNYILILNHIQSIYQQKKEYDNGIIYAKKIIDFIQKDSLVFYNLQELKNSWLGIATIDIANMLALQNKFDESEIYLEKGYGFVKTKDNYGYEAEYEALSVIVNTKLQLGKLAEAKTFLQRMDSLDILAKQNNYLFFKRIKYFNVAANYYEKVGNYELAIHFNNLAKPLKDSLDKRNDANKLQKISQRLQAEKFNEKLTLVENEKQLNKWLRNIAFVLMFAIGAIAYLNYKRIQNKRKHEQELLENAKKDLETYINSLHEKSTMVDNLRIEIERLNALGEKSNYLEQLSNKTILTDDDWTQFKQLFEKVYPDFITEQKQLYPNLTPAETRLLVLDQLNLSNLEMANMLGVSKNTISQTRLRLKKKTNTD